MSTPAKIQLEKRRFIHRMGPYYRQAAAEGDKSEVKFLQTVFSQYCTRWPLNTKDLSELDDMEGFMEAERKALNRSLKGWAGLSVFDVERHWSQLFRYKEATPEGNTEFIETSRTSDNPNIKPFDVERHWSQLLRHKEGTSKDDAEFVKSSGSSMNQDRKPPKVGSKENPIDVDNHVVILPVVNGRPRPRPRFRNSDSSRKMGEKVLSTDD